MSQLTQLTYVQQMAIADYMDDRYLQKIQDVAQKHCISHHALYYYLFVEHGRDTIGQRESYILARQSKARLVDKRGVVKYVRPSWYTGSPQIKWVPRHHILWCLAHRFTCKPPHDVVWNIDGNYLDAPPEAYQLLSKSQHRTYLNKLSHTAASK
jgi:hypothetical protein